MKKIVLFAVLFVAMMPLLCSAQAVKVGVEVLRDSNFKGYCYPRQVGRAADCQIYKGEARQCHAGSHRPK